MANDNMVVVAAVARKGGSGKSALVKALASAALSAGKTTLLIDTDPQGDLTRWYDRAAKGGLTPSGAQFAAVSDTQSLEAVIDEAYSGGATDFVFIDTAGVGGAWADDIAMLSDHLVTPVVATVTNFDVGTQTVEWFRRLHDRVERPEDLPPHHVVITQFPAKASKLELALLEEATTRFPVINSVIQHRNAYHMMDAQGFLGEILRNYRDHPNPLQRSHARHYEEALMEATDVLNDILAN
ncbi:ParA family protein [Rubellimicrobium roseum]|uniref:ParA family protein n=1 Tax=Rubellimicrobium roseum TaxID=687525 RepID=A0A5C4NCB2_9RHOB|nr:ParA family protein [Rubellimicrobium roseum]TNC66266.1 ParA family protein [Rubellimicrobium roseum]